MRRFSALLLALVLAASFYFGLVVASPSAQAAPPITPSPTKPMTGEKFTITGTLKTKVVRPVELQALIGKKWKLAGSAEIRLVGGKFSYNFKPASKGKWHIVASYLGSLDRLVTYKTSMSATRVITVK